MLLLLDGVVALIRIPGYSETMFIAHRRSCGRVEKSHSVDSIGPSIT